MEKEFKAAFESVRDFSSAWLIAFVSVWVLLITPVLSLLGRGIMFMANLGEKYLDSRQITRF